MQKTESFKQYLNSQHTNMKFTSDIEINKCLFPDIITEEMASLLRLFVAQPHSTEFLQIIKALNPNLLSLP